MPGRQEDARSSDQQGDKEKRNLNNWRYLREEKGNNFQAIITAEEWINSSVNKSPGNKSHHLPPQTSTSSLPRLVTSEGHGDCPPSNTHGKGLLPVWEGKAKATGFDLMETTMAA